MRLLKLTLVCGVLALVVASSGCNRLKARDQLNKGVGAFRNAQFQAAIKYFQSAVDLDPTLLNARLYLATAYAQQYIPGGASPENVKVAQQAIAAFEEVLKRANPEKEQSAVITAIASIAQIYYNMQEFDKAKEYQKRRLSITPNDPEPYYWIGVLDWHICYPRRMGVRKDLNLTAPKDLNRPDVLPPLPEQDRAQLEKDNAELIEEGIKYLQKAVDLKPNDADAMAYINLMYREKADILADATEREVALKTADEWVQKALNMKKKAAEKASAAVQ